MDKGVSGPFALEGPYESHSALSMVLHMQPPDGKSQVLRLSNLAALLCHCGCAPGGVLNYQGFSLAPPVLRDLVAAIDAHPYMARKKLGLEYDIHTGNARFKMPDSYIHTLFDGNMKDVVYEAKRRAMSTAHSLISGSSSASSSTASITFKRILARADYGTGEVKQGMQWTALDTPDGELLMKQEWFLRPLIASHLTSPSPDGDDGNDSSYNSADRSSHGTGNESSPDDGGQNRGSDMKGDDHALLNLAPIRIPFRDIIQQIQKVVTYAKIYR
ncbi:hypothetical protein CSOJ01_09029 [Colletotrichum sojae]|uniref:Uncharacterized protein n=1 Tax=Colletotrichum sojae TaxID=2175907 RepID=A0A8H6MS21_9PEZI|nr:hypothetical protein CSOJ01_09029 [Colletotrichum sojae]